jgi:hypothetical protein
MRVFSRLSFVMAFAIAVPALHAQGALSVQGFGYPGGQLSTQALSTGGSMAEFDPQSPLNPAALAVGKRALVYLQYDPEFRSVTVPGTTVSTTTARFPMFAVSGRYGKATFGLSFSSYVDRTWTNSYADTQIVSGQTVGSRLIATSSGGISDLRVAMAWTFSPTFFVGLGLHAFPGTNRPTIGRVFDDSVSFGNFTTTNTMAYNGTAISVGFVAVPFGHLNIGASGRYGGTLRVRLGDSTVLGEGRVPTRYGASLAYDGIAGTVFSARFNSEKWTDLKGLGTPGLQLHDANEVAAGIETVGPRLSGLPSVFRVGYRDRDLPFSIDATPVKERSINGGLGLPFAHGYMGVDLGVAHAVRTSGTITETGWIVSIGLAIRP